MIDYAENLCEAMKIIFDKQIKQLSFDITIDATVVDASKAESGVYTVSHDGATFIAYSTDTSFKEKDVVMVTVPQGNYDNQKMIIGKQVDKDKEEKPITYQSPFSQMINLSGNLIYGDNGEKGLLANGGNQYRTDRYQELLEKGNNLTDLEREEKEQIEQNIKDAQIVFIKEISFNPQNSEHYSNGYNRLGLKIDFSTWLNDFNIVSGNYGVILTLTFQDPDNINKEDKYFEEVFTFDSSEFFGDIYNFETFYNQEAVFDISNFSNYFLTKIKLEGYQSDDFQTSQGTLLTYQTDDFGSNMSTPIANIFMKNPYICLGSTLEDFKKDDVKILTLNSSTYQERTDEKNLILKWIHKDLQSNEIYRVKENEIPEGYEVRWYRFKLGESSPDKFMDAHWVRFYGCKRTPDSNGNYYIIDPSDAEDNQDIATNKINIQFQPDKTNQTEQLRALILKDNGKSLAALSPIITFYNDKEVPNKANKIDANALGIQFTDAAKGKYYYYDKIGKILQQEKSQEIRTLKAIFKDNTILEDKQDLHDQTYTLIEWTFPKGNTMIIPLTPNGEEITENSIIEDVTIDQTNENYYKFSFSSSEGNNKSVLETFKYKINENYSYNKSRNTVYLKTIINGQTYISSATMFFGISGTSGSDYTIIVDWGETGQDPPVFEVKNNGILKGSVRLQDPNGENVNLNENAEYEYSWYQIKKGENLDGLSIIDKENNNSLGENNSIFKLKNINSQVTMNDLYVLEVKLKNFGDYNLIARYPIALKRGSDNFLVIDSITGTTIVRYASDGTITPDDKNPYSISFQYYDLEEENFIPANEKEAFGYWHIIRDNEIDNFFLPELIEAAENNNTIIAFILKLKSIEITNNETLLDIILHKKIRQKDNFQTQEPIDLLIYNIENNEEINNGILMSEENFKQYLYTIKNSALKKLFSVLEKTYPIFSSNFIKINPILSPPSIYLKDIPVYGIQYILSNPPQGIPAGNPNGILYTQPIYIYHDNYPSTTINQWNGKEMIFNEEEGTFITNGFSAGKKEKDDNTFSGVMIGDWSKTLTDSSISGVTGIYGFNHGIMSYAFKEDGTAFIGKDGIGRIDFDGNNGIIQSAYFNLENKIGSQFNLKEGVLYLFGERDFTNNQKNLYSLILNSNPKNNNDPIFSINRDINMNYYQGQNMSSYENNFIKLQNYLKKYSEDLLQNFLLIQLYENNSSISNNTIQTFQEYITNLKPQIESLNENIITTEFLEASSLFLQLYPYYENFRNNENIFEQTNSWIINTLNKQKNIFTELNTQNQAGDYENYSCRFISANKDYFDNEKIYYNEQQVKIENPVIESVDNYFEKEYIFNYIFNQNNTDIIFSNSEKKSYYKPNTKKCYFYSLTSNFLNIMLNYYVDYLYNQHEEIKSNQDNITPLIERINSEIGENYYNTTSFIDTKKMDVLMPKIAIKKDEYYAKIIFENNDNYFLHLNNKLSKAYYSDIFSFSNKKIQSIIIYYKPTSGISVVKFSYDFLNKKKTLNPFQLYELWFTPNLNYELKDTNLKTSIRIVERTDTTASFCQIKKQLYNKYISNNYFLNNSTSELINITSALQADINSYISDIYKWQEYDSKSVIEQGNNPKTISVELTPSSPTIITIGTQSYTDYQNELFIPLFQDMGNGAKDKIISLNYIGSDFGFVPLDWTNDLIYLNKKGGYLTSVNYRPTMDYWATTVKKPTDNQKWGTNVNNYEGASNDYTYGMKGFIIDLTNDRIVLGNNSSIIGYQSDYRKDYEGFGLRQFYIGTGGTYGSPNENGLEYLLNSSLPNNSHFIRARAALGARREPIIDIFTVRWDGMTYCRELFVHKGFYFGSESNKVKRGHFTTTSSGLVFIDQDTRETVTNPRILYF